jgi:tetratricopeptide (TPR) repeat protein
MQSRQSFILKPRGAVPVLLAAFLFAWAGACGTVAQAFDDGSETSDDVEHPADVAPGDAEMAPEDESIEPDELDPETLMRPEMKQGGENAPPPRSAEERKQDKLSPHSDDLPLPTPQEKPKMLAELYVQLGKARNAEAAVPIVEAIEVLWRFSGSDTVDLLMHRAERFARDEDLDLALEILDATVDIDPEQAEAWHLRAKVHYLKKDYGQAVADLRRALDRDPNHFAAMNDLGVVLEAIGAKKEALEAYRKALAINPFLPESTKQAVEELRREVEGQDI